MIHAYDEVYLSKAQNNFGTMLDFAVYDLKQNLSDFYGRFLRSKICSGFENGDSRIIAGSSGVELAISVIESESKSENYHPAANRSPEFWCGWAIAYFQWQTNLSFHQIENLIPIDEVLALYSPYHEMDISQFCDKMRELYNKRKINSNLKNYRLKAALSQKQLSEFSNVPVRTIQQYEQGQKNINYAKAETVINLAKALNCQVQDLIEI
ncbi:MAG: helix-turn-helix domain-containing protein [Treponemataceae bacterium]|nr:helix-turn-helix domain-containing protein [Treponemataceae bacterium]